MWNKSKVKYDQIKKYHSYWKNVHKNGGRAGVHLTDWTVKINSDHQDLRTSSSV